MKSNKISVQRLLDESVFKDKKFEEHHKQQVLNRISKKGRNINWVPKTLNVVFSLILLISIGYLLSDQLRGVGDAPVQQGRPESPQPPRESNTTAATPPTKNSESPAGNSAEDDDNHDDDSTSEDILFELTSEEQLAYKRFAEDFDTAHLKNLEPLSIAKLYVQASYEQNFEMQYELMTDRAESIMWDKEYDANIPLEDRASPKEVVSLFTNLEEGEFINTEEHAGFIKFNRTNDAEGVAGFQMIQNEDGVWQVAFMPLQ